MKWEYLVESSINFFDEAVRTSNGQPTYVNELGSQGWELVALAYEPIGMIAVFKRPKRN